MRSLGSSKRRGSPAASASMAPAMLPDRSITTTMSMPSSVAVSSDSTMMGRASATRQNAMAAARKIPGRSRNLTRTPRGA